MADRILTTHAGSLPRPLALTGLYARSAAGGQVDEAEMARAGKAALTDILARQAAAGIDIANNGEQQREAFFLYLRHRLSGIGGRWKRPARGDVAEYPDFAEAMANALDGKVAVSNMDPPMMNRNSRRDGCRNVTQSRAGTANTQAASGASKGGNATVCSSAVSTRTARAHSQPA